MRMATPETDSTSFYNVTIEDDNGVTEMYVIKYTPEETWLDNKDQPYEGNITTARVNNFTHILPDDQGGGAGEDYGDLGYNFTEPQGSPYYTTDCNGIVYVTMESIPYQCSCEDHWPNQTCYCGINGNPGYQPGFNEVPYYYCDENSDTIDDSEQNGNTNTDTTTGGITTTGSGNNSNPDNNLITVLLNPDEECEAPEGDLNGDCILNNYEVCLLNGYNQDVCDCVALGNQLSDCVDDATNCSAPDDIFNSYYSNLSPFNVDLSNLRAPCDETIDTLNVAENAKFMCIYNKLTQSPKFKDLFINTFGESSDANIKFELVDFPDNNYGKNIANVNNIEEQIIQININHLTTKHPLTIAQTIIHEAIHAYLKVKAYECTNSISVDALNNQELDQLLNQFNYGCLSTAVNEHDLMFNILVPYMQQLLNEVFNDLVALEDLESIFNFYPCFTCPTHTFTWQNALYFMSLAGLDDTDNPNDAFSTEIPIGSTEFYLYNQYNILINHYDTSTIPPSTNFNYNTCND